MLALNAPRSVFLADSRHEALPDLRAPAAVASAVGPWSLARAKFGMVSVFPTGGGNLTAIRCELPDGPDPGADPGTALIRYVLQRAHGKLRNVWREGLIAVSAQTGTALTKREARDLVESRTVDLGETLAGHLLGLRLIDVPATHFPALHAALAASAGT
jgi:hypothetical protein